MQPVSVVIATRDRRSELLQTLARLRELNPDAPVIVVDNGSTDGSPEAAREQFPEVEVVRLEENLGAAARNEGVRRARTPYVAFADDDSWWAAGSLARAARHLDEHPRLAVLAGRILVGPEERLDPTCAAMAESPLPADPRLPGPPLLGFVACGAVVRRAAFLDVGGFLERFVIIAEEELLALDLVAAGWGLAYVDDVVAHHHPSPARNRRRWMHLRVRNGLWTTWLRRRGRGLLTGTLDVVLDAMGEDGAKDGLVDALKGVPWVLRGRRALPPEVERLRRRLEPGWSPLSSLRGVWKRDDASLTPR